MYLEDFRSITDFNNEDVLLRLGSPISEHCASILKEIGLYLFQKNLQKNRAETIVEGRAKEYNQDRQIPVQKEADKDEVNIHESPRTDYCIRILGLKESTRDTSGNTD